MLSAVASAMVVMRSPSARALASMSMRTFSASAFACAICVASSSATRCTPIASCRLASA